MSILSSKVIFSVLLIYGLGHQSNTQRTKADLERLNKALVPKYLPGPIEEVLELYYHIRKNLGVKVDIGNVMYHEWMVHHPPNVTWTCDKNAYYTLIMANPQHHPGQWFIEHSTYTTWLVSNIVNCNISTGEEIFEYEVPRPHFQIGQHIYLWAVFKQSLPKVTLSQPTVSGSLPLTRVDYTLGQIIQNLTLGNAFAANYINLNGTLEDYLYEEPSFSDSFDDPAYFEEIGGTRFPPTNSPMRKKKS